MHPEIAIIGGGPVGLTLAILLIRRGYRVRVFEARNKVSEHSRAIGLHPPALEVLAEAGIAQQLHLRGLQIRQGLGSNAGKQIAKLNFASLPGNYRYVLSLPQPQTQLFLRQRLASLAPAALSSGHRFLDVLGQGSDSVHFTVRDRAGTTQVHTASWLIGADGVNSALRQVLAVPWQGKKLPDSYRMGDYPDHSSLGEHAVLYLHREGIVESFPLPENQRRWVTWRPPQHEESLEQLVGHRTGHRLDPATCTMRSDFNTAQFAVTSMVHGRIVLIGDAAHQISPIGGQGLALGLLDASALAAVLDSKIPARQLGAFERSRLGAARLAARRAKLNMMLGRPLPQLLVSPRNAIFSQITSHRATHDSLAQIFTMTDAAMSAQTHRQNPVDT